MRKTTLCLALIAFVAAGCAGPMKRFDPAKHKEIGKGDGDFTFVVLGDSRPDGSKSDKTIQPEAFLTNIERANSYEHDFVIDIGDLVLGYCDPDLLVREWDAFDETIKLFDKPFVMVLGNHDVYDAPSEKIWLDRYGPLHFSWDHKGCHFIALDSDKVGQLDNVTGSQLEWLKRDLEAAKDARRIFVLLHKPLWAYDHGNWIADVHPLLAKHGVDTVFAGHWHEYCLHPTKDGVKYVVTGGGGAEIGSGIADFHHILLVDVKGNTSSFKVVTPEKELPAEIVTLEVLRAVEKALTVDATPKPSESGATAVMFEIANPLDREAKGFAVLDGEGTSWKSARVDIVVPPGGKATVKLETTIAGGVFPLPKCEIQMKVGETRLIDQELYPDVSLLVAELPSRPVDDFEDGDLRNLCGVNGISRANGPWEAKCDSYGKSKMDGPAVKSMDVSGKSSRVLHVSGFLGTSNDPDWCWAALEGWLQGTGVSVDLTPSVGVSFKARSDTENNLRVMVEGTIAGKRLAAKGAAPCRRVQIGKEWKTYKFYWHEFKQEPWICPGPDCVDGAMTVDKVEYFNWGFRDEGKKFDLMLDDVKLIYEKK